MGIEKGRFDLLPDVARRVQCEAALTGKSVNEWLTEALVELLSTRAADDDSYRQSFRTGFGQAQAAFDHFADKKAFLTSTDFSFIDDGYSRAWDNAVENVDYQLDPKGHRRGFYAAFDYAMQNHTAIGLTGDEAWLKESANQK